MPPTVNVLTDRFLSKLSASTKIKVFCCKFIRCKSLCCLMSLLTSDWKIEHNSLTALYNHRFLLRYQNQIRPKIKPTKNAKMASGHFILTSSTLDSESTDATVFRQSAPNAIELRTLPVDVWKLPTRS